MITNGRHLNNGWKSTGLRICHLGKFYPPASGGMESHVRTLAQAQAELGANVRVICVNHQDRAARDVTWEAFTPTETIEECDGPAKVIRLGRRASIARLDICLELPRRLGQLNPGNVDVLHLHVPNPTMLLALAGVRPRVPLVVTYHSDVVRQKVLGMFLRPIEHLVFRGAAGIFATSPQYAGGSDLLRHYERKLGVLPHGIDLEPYLNPCPSARSHAERLRLKHGDPVWLSVGRLVYYKGFHTAIRALANVPGKLIIIGDGPLENDLKQLAQEIGGAERVIWLRHVSQEELVGCYHAATALWFPSNARSEAFGLVQVEAMASGCPVINTAIPNSGVPWVSRHEESGLTVPVGNANALASAARRLLDEPGLRTRLGCGARARAQQHFDHLVMAKRSLAVYEASLEGKRSHAVQEALACVTA